MMVRSRVESQTQGAEEERLLEPFISGQSWQPRKAYVRKCKDAQLCQLGWHLKL